MTSLEILLLGAVGVLYISGFSMARDLITIATDHPLFKEVSSDIPTEQMTGKARRRVYILMCFLWPVYGFIDVRNDKA